jgi:hypothetical protein
MQNKCIVSQHASSVWKTLITGGLIVTVLFIVLSAISDAPLFKGVFRLIAFSGFAITALSYLQFRGKPQEIELEFDTEHLIITYFGESKKTQEELFELETISRIVRIENPRVWKIVPRSDCSKFLISFTDHKTTLSLFRFEGRDLCISHQDAQRAERFLEECPVDV